VSDLAKHQLAGLAVLDRTVEIAMHALVQSYTEFGREIRPTDTAEVRSAAALVELCAHLLEAIDHHRRLVRHDLAGPDRNWPF
jgi:hypothetical protein